MTGPASTTPALLRAWADGGERSAVDALLDAHLDFLHREVRRQLGPRLRAQFESMDVVQEVALEVFETGPRFVVEDDRKLRALLARMVRNTIVDRDRWFRAAKRDSGREQRRDAPSVDLTSPRRGPATEIAEQEEAELVRLAVELLDDDDRQVVKLHQLEGVPMAEVAERLELGVTAAHMRYKRALPRLALKMQSLLRGEAGT